MGAVLQDSELVALFEKKYGEFAKKRDEVRTAFLNSRFDMVEEAWRQSGTDLDLDAWLLHTHDLHRRNGGPHFWMYAKPYRPIGEDGLWRILFSNGFDDGRNGYVAAFNDLLESKKMRTRLGDNGVQMFFTDVARHRPRR